MCKASVPSTIYERGYLFLSADVWLPLKAKIAECTWSCFCILGPLFFVSTLLLLDDKQSFTILSSFHFCLCTSQSHTKSSKTVSCYKHLLVSCRFWEFHTCDGNITNTFFLDCRKVLYHLVHLLFRAVHFNFWVKKNHFKLSKDMNILIIIPLLSRSYN